MSTDYALVRKNTFYSSITIFTRLFANVFLFWLLARFYGPNQFGIFTFAHSLATTFIILADFGLDVLLITEIAANQAQRKEIIEKLFSVKLIFVILAFLLMIAIAQIFPIARQSFLLIVVFGIYLIFTSLNNFLFGIYRGYEKFIFETRVSLISNISLLILSLIAFFLKIDLIYIAVIFAFTRIVGVLFSLYYLNKLDPSLKLKLNATKLGILKNKTFVYGVHLVFSYLFFQVDTLLLAKLSGEYSVGIYQSVFKLIMLPLVVPDILINSLLPTLSRLYTKSKQEWISMGGIMGRILIIVIIPVSVIFFDYSRQIIDLIYGLNKFSDSVTVLKIFGLILFIRFLLEPFALMLTTSDRQKIRMVVVIIATILNISLNIFIIPRFGVNGAAVVSLLVNTFVGLVYFLYVEKQFRFWLFDYKNLLLLISSLLFLWILNSFVDVNFILQILIFIFFYLILIITFYLRPNEKKLIISIITKIHF
jgi:O-antigen/teichoic acid export membrane protein